ncbi:MAG: hypothetical protein V2A64_05860, partial [Candidatus Omnitrophota bacterium]
MEKKGVALFLVLAILFGVILLSGVVLNLITSQSKLTDHQVKRMQAYYAAQAGINYGFEQLRLNNPNWLTDTATSRTFRICGSVYGAANSAECTTGGNVGNITDDTFPPIINFVSITIGPRDAGTNERTVNATVDYSDS